MAIEPLTSIMTVQAQTYPSKQNTNSLNSQANTQNIVDMDKIVSNNYAVVKETSKSELNKDNKKYSNDENLSKEDKKKVKEYINKMNKELINKGTLFSLHEDSNRVQITIVNKETREVLKEIPPKQFLDAAAKRKELIGFTFDEKR